MSFGTSVGDIILLIQLAHKNYRNCKEAGGEYIEIAREVRSLHSVLRTVRAEVEREDSLIFKFGPEKTKELTEIADGCKGVLEGIDTLLTKYKGLSPDSVEIGKAAKFWQRIRFGTEIEDLGKLRWKIITYTSTLAVFVDSINLKATEHLGDVAGRIENRMESGFADLSDRLERFEDMRKAILMIATRARASQRYQAMDSVLSLSTYADDDKEVWRQFRSQLVSLGFKSDSLDRHMEVLKAYMMKLDQTGVLDEAVEQSDVAMVSWCGNPSFRTTNLSLLGTTEMAEQVSEVQDPKYSQKRSISHDATPSTLQSPAANERSDDAASSSSRSPVEPPTRTRHRIPRIKVEQPNTTQYSERSRAPRTPTPMVSPGLTDSSQAGRTDKSKPDIDSGIISISNPQQPRPYAESYYSISEAATSHSTLLKEISRSTKPSSSSKDPRPRNTIRPTSWSGPESRKPVSKNQATSIEVSQMGEMSDLSDSDTIVDPSKLRKISHESEISPISSAEKVDEWLKLPSQQRRTRASSSPIGNPSTRSMEELHLDRAKSGSRPSSATGPRKNVKFDSRGSLPGVAPDLFKTYFGESTPLPSAHKSRDNAQSDSQNHLKLRRAEEMFKEYLATDKTADDNHPNPNSNFSSRSNRPRKFQAGGNTGSANENFYYTSTRSRTPKATLNGKEIPPSQAQQVAKAALIAGAVEAFRVRNEEGSWSGDKARRILTAAIGAAGVDAMASSGRQDLQIKPVRTDDDDGRGRLRTAFQDKEKDRAASDFDSNAHERNPNNNDIRASVERSRQEKESSRRNTNTDQSTSQRRDRDRETQTSRMRSQINRPSRERDQNGDRSSNLARQSSIMAAVLGGLAANRLLNGQRREVRGKTDRREGRFVASDSESEYDSGSEFDSDSDSDSDSDTQSDEESPPERSKRHGKRPATTSPLTPQRQAQPQKQPQPSKQER